MRSEFEQEAKDLIKKLDNCSITFGELYQHLKRVLFYQLLIMFTLLFFISIALVVPEGTRHKISYIIIPLIMLNYIMVVLYRNSQKRKMKAVYEEGVNYMGRLSDIIDWTSIRNKYINKEDKKVVNSITAFVILVEKPFSPFRRFRVYYRLILYFSLALSIIAIIFYIVYVMSLMGICELGPVRTAFLNWLK